MAKMESSKSQTVPMVTSNSTRADTSSRYNQWNPRGNTSSRDNQWKARGGKPAWAPYGTSLCINYERYGHMLFQCVLENNYGRDPCVCENNYSRDRRVRENNYGRDQNRGQDRRGRGRGSQYTPRYVNDTTNNDTIHPAIMAENA